MTPEQAQQLILDYGWTATERIRVRNALELIETLPECRDAVGDYDRIRSILEHDRRDCADFSDAALARMTTAIQNFERPRFARWIGPISIAAALAVAYILGWYTPGRDSTRPGVHAANSMAVRMVPTPEETRHYISLFDELGAVFENRAGWMLISHGETDLGIDRRPTVSTEPSSRPFVLRIGAIDDGGLLAIADLVIEPGQSADSVIPLGESRSLRISVNTPLGAKFAPRIRVEVFDPQDESQRAEAILAASMDLQPGQIRSAGQLQTLLGGLEIRVASGSSL